MRISWFGKQKRRRILSAAFLIGTVLWMASLWMIPENTIARLNQLTITPELRWMKGGGFLITVLSGSGLFVDAAYEKLVPRLDDFLSKIDLVLKHPLNWLILALMTYSVHTTNLEIIVLNLFVIMYLTIYQVIEN